jgi:hypothetical protein
MRSRARFPHLSNETSPSGLRISKVDRVVEAALLYYRGGPLRGCPGEASRTTQGASACGVGAIDLYVKGSSVIKSKSQEHTGLKS